MDELWREDKQTHTYYIGYSFQESILERKLQLHAFHKLQFLEAKYHQLILHKQKQEAYRLVGR